jgi:hypothetical protein
MFAGHDFDKSLAQDGPSIRGATIESPNEHWLGQKFLARERFFFAALFCICGVEATVHFGIEGSGKTRGFEMVAQTEKGNRR